MAGARTGPRSIRENRKEAIISAAAEVLRTQGVAGCTVRNIAESGNFAKSAIHYYFTEIDDIVDLAFERLLLQFIDRIEKAAASCDAPEDALWAAAAEYVRIGADGPGTDRAPMVAFDYHVASTRRGDNSAMISLASEFTALLARLVAETGIPDPEDVSDTLFSALVGTVVRIPLDRRHPDEVLGTIWRTLRLPSRPTATQPKCPPSTTNS